jgi:hypothetical protein
MAKRDLTPQEQIAVLHHHTLGTQRPIFPRAISPHAVTEDGRRRHSSDDAATDDDDDMSDYSDFEESPVVKKRGKLSSAPRREACLGATPLTRGHPVVIRQEASSSSSTPQKDVSRPVFPRPSAFTAVHVPQRQGPAFAVPEDLTTKPKLVTPIVLLRASDDKDSPAAAGFVTAKKKFPSEPTLSPAAPAKIKNESRRSDGDEKVVASGEQSRGSDNMWRPW